MRHNRLSMNVRKPEMLVFRQIVFYRTYEWVLEMIHVSLLELWKIWKFDFLAVKYVNMSSLFTSFAYKIHHSCMWEYNYQP